MKKNNYLVLLFCLLTYMVNGQINTYSPYSYFGVGSIYNQGSSINNSLGGLGASLQSQYILNNVNPSSYSSLTLTSFEIGLSSSFTEMFQNDLSQKNYMANLLNIGLGFPISEKIGFAVGLSPYSIVGYNVNSIINNLYAGEITYNYNGSGGINKMLFGSSYEILTGLTVGVNVNYLFGTLDRQTVIFSENSSTYFRDNSSNIISDLSPEIGLLLSRKFNTKKVNFGIVIKPENELKSRTDVFQHTFSQTGEYEYFLDTILDTSSDLDYLKLPLELKTGLSLEFNNNLFLGLDYHYTNWSNYSVNNSNYSYLIDNSIIILGGSYIPNKQDIHSYFKRIQYKCGFSYSSGYLDVNKLPNQMNLDSDNILKDISFNFGLSLPMNKVFSMAHIGLRYGIRSDTDNNFIEERYFNIFLSMTLNEKWFNKRKIQ